MPDGLLQFLRHSVIYAAVTYTHAMNKHGKGVISPLDR
jgi:hypothetical protein